MKGKFTIDDLKKINIQASISALQRMCAKNDLSILKTCSENMASIASRLAESLVDELKKRE